MNENSGHRVKKRKGEYDLPTLQTSNGDLSYHDWLSNPFSSDQNVMETTSSQNKRNVPIEGDIIKSLNMETDEIDNSDISTWTTTSRMGHQFDDDDDDYDLSALYEFDEHIFHPDFPRCCKKHRNEVFHSSERSSQTTEAATTQNGEFAQERNESFYSSGQISSKLTDATGQNEKSAEMSLIDAPPRRRSSTGSKDLDDDDNNDEKHMKLLQNVFDSMHKTNETHARVQRELFLLI